MEPHKDEQEIKKEVKQKPIKKEKVLNLYDQLSKPIDERYVVEYLDRGMKLKGFQAIAAVNRLNEVVGIENWKTETKFLYQERLASGWAIAMDVTIIINYNGKEISKQGTGAAFAKKIEDAYKGARTSAFKNTCKYLGIGKELYEETKIDDDISSEEIVYEKINNVVDDNVIDNKEDELIKRINEISNKEQLKAIEDEVKAIKVAKVFKAYNDKKINLLTKK